VEGASLEVFRLLINRFPECLRIKTFGEATPLRLASHGNVSANVLELLIDACPQQLIEPDDRQNTPLPAACTMGSSEEIILLLLGCCKYALKMKPGPDRHRSTTLEPSDATNLTSKLRLAATSQRGRADTRISFVASCE
jgi:hypothetical protein